MADSSPFYLENITTVADRIRRGEITSLKLTLALIRRIKEVDDRYQSYASLMEDEAIEQAKAADDDIAAGNYKGPLHGVPIAVKDIFETKDTLTAVGSTIYKNRVTDKDSAVIEKLKKAGAVILGKLNMTEFALSGYHPDMPVPVNPWNEDYWSGVSSSGPGVATAAGLAFGTLGTDTGGSIRFPSSSNAVVGIKPTFGKVSRYGTFPLSNSLDHIGPMARSVKDAAIMLQVIAGFDARDPYSSKGDVPDYMAKIKNTAKGLRIGVDEKYIAFEGVHPEVIRTTKEAINIMEKAGAEIVPVDMAALVQFGAIWGGIVAYEALKIHGQTFPSRSNEYGPVFRELLEAGATISEADYREMQQGVQQAKAIVEAALSNVDVLLCPASPVPTGTTASLGPQVVLPPEVVAFFVCFTAPFNYSGSPTITIPCGFEGETQMPLGLQFIGKHGGEADIIRAGYAYEQLTDWHNQIPENLD